MPNLLKKASSERESKVLVGSIRDLLELKGSLKVNRLISPKQIRATFEEHLSKKAKRK